MNRRAALTLTAAAAAASLLAASPAAAESIEDTFRRHAPGSKVSVDHTEWTALLQAYVVAGADGLNRVRYAAWKAEAQPRLKAYVARLKRVDVAALDRPEQFAFWANLYNAKTIDIVLDRYPVSSIKDISLGGTLLANFTGGPWKAKVAKVAGHDLSLDDIEHVIMRGIFKDPRVHYAVNCASVGCPNLAREAFTGARLEAALETLARAFVNSPRGVRVAGGRVTASSIYSWFQVDFGGSSQGVIAHASRYAEPALKQKLEGITTVHEFAYDWSLNDASK
jgi:hypothetical protein